MRTCAVARVGYRVPRSRFDGIVHSVFARACYIACDGSLLTVGAVGVADGPTTLVLGPDGPADLRGLFDADDAVRCRDNRIHGRRVVLDIARATTWRAPRP